MRSFWVLTFRVSLFKTQLEKELSKNTKELSLLVYISQEREKQDSENEKSNQGVSNKDSSAG